MSDIVTVQPTANPVQPKAAKRVRIPKRIGEVVHLVVTGECKTVKAAAERTGMNANYCYGAMKKPEIQAFIARKTRESIAAGTMRASARLLELLDASSEHVSLDASKHVLAIEGIAPPERGGVNVSISNTIAPGYVLDLRPDPVTIEHEPVQTDEGS